VAITKQKKVEILKNLETIVKDSGSIVLTNFKGLSVADATAMRRELKSKGIGYYVAKKNLIARALKAGSFEGTEPELEGEMAVAYGKDILSPAREVYQFQKKFDKKISIAGGVFDGKFLNQEGMLEIALIPGEDTLRGMFVNLINSPIQRIVIALDQIAGKKPTA